MAWPSTTPNVQDKLETTLRDYLQAQTKQEPYNSQLSKAGVKKANVYIVGEEEPALPVIEIRKTQRSRTENKLPVIQGDPPFRRETWRLQFVVEADESSGGLRSGSNSLPSNAILSQLIEDVMMNQAGRTALSALGIHNIRSGGEQSAATDGVLSETHDFICDTCTYIENVQVSDGITAGQ